MAAAVFFRTAISHSQGRGIALFMIWRCAFCVRREVLMCTTKFPHVHLLCYSAFVFVSHRKIKHRSHSLPEARLDEKQSTRCLRSRFSLLPPSMRPPGHRRTLRPSACSKIVRRGPSGGVFSGRVLYGTTVSRRRQGAWDCARRCSGTEVLASSLGKGIGDGSCFSNRPVLHHMRRTERIGVKRTRVMSLSRP